MDQRGQRWIVGGVIASAGLLGVAALQLHSVESRLITQSQQLRALGEATERMASEMSRVKGGGAASSGEREHSLEGVLHPELPNALKSKDTHWPPPGAKLDGEIVRAWPSGDPKGFNTMLENSIDQHTLDYYTTSPLARQNAWTNPDDYYGDLAWRVEVRDEFKEFTFYLEKGVKWHPVPGVNTDEPRHAWLKGDHPVTAHDVVFFLDMLLDPQVQNGFAKSYYAELGSWKALDDHTLQLRWNKTQAGNVEQSMLLIPYPEFLYAHREDGSEIPRATLGLELNQHWYNNKGIVGSGPYRMAEYKPGSHILLDRNEEYAGERPAIQKVRYLVYSDSTLTLLKLKSGELNVGALRAGQYREEILEYQGKPPPKNSPFFDGSVICDVIPRLAYYYIGWNANKPMFADKRVRRALSLATNRFAMIDKVFVGLGSVARGPFLETTPYHAPEIEPLPFDLKQSAALLREAGWEDTDDDGLLDKALTGSHRVPFEFTLLIYGTSPEFSAVANILREDLLGIGIRMSVEAAEWGLMQKRMNEKKFDAFTGAWGLGWSTDPFQLWHSSQADIPSGSNRVGFRHAEADRLIESLRETLDPEKRTQMLRDFHRILHEEQPYTFLFVPKTPTCHTKSVRGVTYAKITPQSDHMPWWMSQGE